MPVVRVVHRYGQTDRVQVNFSEDTVYSIKEKLIRQLGLECTPESVHACLENDRLSEMSADSVDPASDVQTDQRQTLKDLGARNGAFVHCTYPADALPAPAGGEEENKEVEMTDDGADAAPAGPKKYTMPPGISGFQEMARDAEQRRVCVITIHGPDGAQDGDWEVPEATTIGSLKDFFAERYSMDRDTISLSEPDDERSSDLYQRDTVPLAGDERGPELKETRRMFVHVQVEQTAANTQAGGVPDAGSATPGADAVSGGGAAGGGGAVNWGGGGGAAGGVGMEEPSAEPAYEEMDPGSLPLGEDERPPANIRDPNELQRWLQSSFEKMRFQPLGDARKVVIDMHPFLNQHLQKRRMGWLYGRVEEDDTARVEFIYEPPQLGFKNRFLLLDDPDSVWVDHIARSLGYEKVGWLLSCPYRGAARENILTNSEVLFAAEQQLLHKHFVTVLFMAETQEDPGGGIPHTFRSTQAFQVSRQCLKLQREERLHVRPGDDEFVMRTRRSVWATPVDSIMSEKLELTKKVHTAYFVSHVGIVAYDPAEKQLHSRCPPANRRGPEGESLEPTLEQIRQRVFFVPSGEQLRRQPTVRDRMLDILSDFQLILFLATKRDRLQGDVRLVDGEVEEMCEYVRDQDAAGAASFRFKLLIALGEGYLDPIAETEGMDDIRSSQADFKRHVERAYSQYNRPVINPIRSARGTTRHFRERTVGNLLEDLNSMGV